MRLNLRQGGVPGTTLIMMWISYRPCDVIYHNPLKGKSQGGRGSRGRMWVCRRPTFYTDRLRKAGRHWLTLLRSMDIRSRQNQGQILTGWHQIVRHSGVCGAGWGLGVTSPSLLSYECVEVPFSAVPGAIRTAGSAEVLRLPVSRHNIPGQLPTDGSART